MSHTHMTLKHYPRKAEMLSYDWSNFKTLYIINHSTKLAVSPVDDGKYTGIALQPLSRNQVFFPQSISHRKSCRFTHATGSNRYYVTMIEFYKVERNLEKEKGLPASQQYRCLLIDCDWSWQGLQNCNLKTHFPISPSQDSFSNHYWQVLRVEVEDHHKTSPRPRRNNPGWSWPFAWLHRLHYGHESDNPMSYDCDYVTKLHLFYLCCHTTLECPRTSSSTKQLSRRVCTSLAQNFKSISDRIYFPKPLPRKERPSSSS